MIKKYGLISPAPRTDNLIYECFESLTEPDQRKFVKKFREQVEDEPLVNHTLNELLLGAYIARQGFRPQYEPRIGGKTPEWLLTQDGRETRLLVELVNFHLKDKLEKQMWEAFKTGWMWSYWMEPNTDRFYGKIQEKMGKYKVLVEKNDPHYIVAVFGLFSSALTVDERRECLEGEHALFPQYPDVTGVLFFQGVARGYGFEYLQNPYATRKGIELNSGLLPVT